MQEYDSDSILIQEETEEMKTILQRASQRKSELIKNAVKKLAEKYPDEQDQIGNKLVKLWSHLDISKTHILRNVPEKYKRTYIQQEIQPNELEQYFDDMSSLFKDVAGIFSNWADKMQDETIAEKTKHIISNIHDLHKHAEEAIADLKRQLSHIAQFSHLLDLVKELKSECDAIRNLLDERQKFSTAWKIVIKMLVIWKSYDHVASMLADNKKYGAKWISKIDSDATLEKLIEKTGHCPKCDWDMTVWFEKARYNQRKGIERIPKIS